IEQFKLYSQSIDSLLTNIYKDSVSRRNSAMEIVKKIANRPINSNEKAEQDLKEMKEMVANSVLLQLEPYLTSLSAQPINETRIKEAKKVLDNILSLYTKEGQEQIKMRYPWIFQTN
ncbi:MAG: hypothetical protein IKP71_01975, partial [Candidatus Riflebacteria bacterium]|nr:hypothetical protein [Candidatus Riflebacteria bacterium]